MDIKLPIATPPWTKLGKSLESKVRKAIHGFSLLENSNSILVALSGGKDSLSLLYLLSALSGRGFPPFKIYAIHIDGKFSCGAEVGKDFLESICSMLHIDLLKKSSLQKDKDFNCYSCARERRRLIFQTAKELDVKTIAFGHHRDDDTQTLLLNTLHKGEFAGLLPKMPMIHFGVTIIRPLIYIAEEEIVQFAKYYGFSRTTCQCPKGQNSYRKKTSLLIEELEKIFPHARKNLARASNVYGSKKALMP